MADKAPAFQFYPKDFLTDDTVLMMTNEQIGAYVVLLCHAWLTPTGLPAALSSLAKLAHCTPSRFQRCIWDGISGKFQQNADGRWFNARLEIERAKQDDFRAAASRAGKRSGEVRHTNDRSTPVQRPLNEPMNGNATLLSSSASSKSETRTAPIQSRRNFGALNASDPVQLPAPLVEEFQAVIKPKLTPAADPYVALLAWTHDVSDRTVAECGGCPPEAIGKAAFKWWKARLAEDWGAKSVRVQACRHRHQPPCADDGICTKRYLDDCERGVAV